MNYYRRYSGDYLRDTSRLSLVEHGVYTVMLDYYYSEEGPLPLDHDEVCRMIRAFKPDERKAVDKILARYFGRRDDGYHNNRADEEIERAAPLIEAARENGRKGGRRKNPPDNPSGSDTGNQDDNPTGNTTGLEAGEPTGLPNGQHPPSSIHQPPSTNPQPPASIKGQERVGSAPKNGARHARPADESPVVVTLPLRNGTQFEVRQSLVDEFDTAYPAVDVPATLREMRAWCVANENKQKTRQGIKRFMNSWLKDEQAKHGR